MRASRVFRGASGGLAIAIAMTTTATTSATTSGGCSLTLTDSHPTYSTSSLLLHDRRHHRRGSHCHQAALLRSTRVNLFIPPPLARAIAAGGLLVGQAFFLAYAREKQRANAQDADEDSNSNSSSNTSSGGGDGRNDDDSSSGHRNGSSGGEDGVVGKMMAPLEAVQILGVDRANPSLLGEFAIGSVNGAPDRLYTVEDCPVLKNKRDRETARANFERMFPLAVKHSNMFLAGKLSAAFRVCVDPDWDDAGGNEQQQQQQQQQPKQVEEEEVEKRAEDGKQ